MDNEKQYQLERVLEYYGYFIDSEKFKIVCPFHEDKNASLLVDLSKGNWYCFGCQLKGNAKDFVMYMEKCTELQALIQLEKIVRGSKEKNIKVKIEHKTEEQIAKESKQDFLVSKDYYYNLSKVDWFDVDCAELDYLLDRGFVPSVLNKIGCKLTYNDSYPIVFPMLDNGKFRGYVCRTMDPEIQKKRKYLYNKGFKRRTTLVGTYNSKTVMIVEGFMDYLKAVQFGVKNVVAILGWKITDEQIKKLKDAGVINVISALDNDECGKRGTKYLRSFFDVTRFVYPKSIKDIGDMSKKQFDAQKKKTMELYKKKKNRSD